MIFNIIFFISLDHFSYFFEFLKNGIFSYSTWSHPFTEYRIWDYRQQYIYYYYYNIRGPRPLFIHYMNWIINAIVNAICIQPLSHQPHTKKKPKTLNCYLFFIIHIMLSLLISFSSYFPIGFSMSHCSCLFFSCVSNVNSYLLPLLFTRSAFKPLNLEFSVSSALLLYYETN